MRTTPWYDNAELQSIHGMIYGEPTSLEASRFASARLEAWLARSNCSSNIECTASLLSAVLMEHDMPRPSQRALKDRYALAIIR